ncbi:MAG: hypothetical protein KDA24_27315 [Deltaproteobacteria bacterium]|nr:hypothetical protein [Deltaproteobacteria bacterium]
MRRGVASWSCLVALVGAGLPAAAWSSARNLPPTPSLMVSPLDGQPIVEFSPSLLATESLDPEGGTVTYLFEVDSTEMFDSADSRSAVVPHTGVGTVAWDLEDAGVVLEENASTFVRVRAIDSDGNESPPDSISFMVRGPNDPPAIPLLVAPAPGGVGGPTPALVAQGTADPEGDAVRLEFIVAVDSALTDILARSERTLVEDGEEVSWTPDEPLEGDVWWSSRTWDAAQDSLGWAEPRAYSVQDAAPGDAPEEGQAASCATGQRPASWAALGLLGLLVGGRRQRGSH